MITRQQLLSNPEKLRDKARGAMIGLAIGDSFGDAARNQNNQLNYGFTSDFNKGASWSTDDTEFAILTAVTLLDAKGKLTSDHVVKRWLDHVATQDELKRGGASEFEASINLRRGLRPPQTGKYNAYRHSDGAAMRAGPIGILWAGDPERAMQTAQTDAEISHCEDGIWGAQAVAAAVAAAMADADMDEIIQSAMKAVPQGSWFEFAMNKAFEIVDRANGEIFDAWMPLHDELWTSYKAAVAEAVAQAFGVLKLMGKESFRKGIVWAGNFGRDADTIGAICGAVLGAKFGISQIPERWVDKTRFPTGTCLSFTKGLDLLDIADRLADCCMENP